MILFTSYYAKHCNDPNAVAISVKPPEWYRGRHYADLAPTWKLVRDVQRGIITDLQYAEQYLDLLSKRKLDPHRVIEELGDGAILLCYEIPSDFCHRHVAALWITEHTGVEVHEKTQYDEYKLVKEYFCF